MKRLRDSDAKRRSAHCSQIFLWNEETMGLINVDGRIIFFFFFFHKRGKPSMKIEEMDGQSDSGEIISWKLYLSYAFELYLSSLNWGCWSTNIMFEL